MSLRLLPATAAALLCLIATPVSGQGTRATSPQVPACTDFYGHINAAWLRENPLPAGADTISRWDALNTRAAEQRKALLSNTEPGAGTASTQLSALVASALDEPAIEAAGLSTLNPIMLRLEKLRKPRDLAPLLADLHARGLPVLFRYRQAPQHAESPAVRLQPAGLGLPDAALYLRNDPEIARIAADYRRLLAQLLQAMGVPAAKASEQAQWVWSLETELARATLATPLAAHDGLSGRVVNKTYPLLQLATVLKGQTGPVDTWLIEQPGYFSTVQRLLANLPVTHWQAWLRAQIALGMAPYLGHSFREPYEAFFAGTLEGLSIRSRHAWLIDHLEQSAPWLLDTAFQERHVNATQRARAETIAHALRTAQADAITRAEWLSREGKAEALARLEALQFDIAPRLSEAQLSRLQFDRRDFAGNMLKLTLWREAYLRDTPSTALWPVRQWQPLVALMPDTQRLLISAALLQSPILADNASAVDFGSLGTLIGQQISQAFHIWNGNDAAAWNKRANPLVAQYSRYPITPQLHVNGVKTFAQNQADLAGVELAWSALQASGEQGANASQLFFSHWASLWPRHDRETSLAAMSNSLHAPARWRVNGVLVNFPAFAHTYGCKGRDAMLRPNKDHVALWR